MRLFTDQTGRVVSIPDIPRRIVSLVPSQTELLFDLGLQNEIVGITKFCIHPDSWFQNKTKVGGTKTINSEKIHELQPDLIIANKEENVKEQIEVLEKIYPVWISDIKNLQDAIDMIKEIGLIVNRAQQAQELTSKINLFFEQLSIPAVRLKTAYIIWQKPYMTVGRDTFIHDMIEKAGFENIFSFELRYPIITLEQLKSIQCELLLLSSEPYPFTQKNIAELQKQLHPTRIMLVDGEMFSWYGSRLLKATDYFQNLHQQII